MYAIIETGGKQYRVQEGDEIYIEKLSQAEGETVHFDRILLISNENNTVAGNPYVANAMVTGKVKRHGKGKKLVVFKYKPKKNYHKKQGHRQPYTKVTIAKIQAS